MTIENPSTGANISRPFRDGDAEIYDVSTGAWRPAFSWFEGRVSTGAARDFEDPDCQQRRILRALSSELGAHVVGEEGERYA